MISTINLCFRIHKPTTMVARVRNQGVVMAMLTVKIEINGRTILSRSISNAGRPADPYGNVRYVMDDGTVILHKPADGAAKLARMILETVPLGPIDNK